MYPLWLGMPGRFQQKRSRDLLPQVLRHAIVECPDCGKKNHVQELAIRVRMKCGRCQRILGIEGGDGTSEPIRTPRLTVRCEYPETGSPPSEVTFGLPPRYGIHTAREAHDWFLTMIAEHEEVRGRDG